MPGFAKKHFTYLGIAISVFLIIISIPLQHNIDSAKGRFDSIHKTLFLSASTLKKLSFGYNLLVADIYWIRALQYFSSTEYYEEKAMETYHYFDIITDLDPHFVNAYRFGGTLLAEPPDMGLGEIELGIKLFEKGRLNNPDNFRIVLDEAFIYYIYTDDYKKASDLFNLASEKVTNSELRKASIKGMAAQALTKSGNLELSRKIWTYIYKTTTHEGRKKHALTNLKEVEAKQYEIALTDILRTYIEDHNNLPDNLNVLFKAGYINRVPEDPVGGEFIIIPDTQKVVSSKLAKKLYDSSVRLLNVRSWKFNKLYNRYPRDLSELKQFLELSPINKFPENPYGREFAYNPDTGEVK